MSVLVTNMMSPEYNGSKSVRVLSLVLFGNHTLDINIMFAENVVVLSLDNGDANRFHNSTVHRPCRTRVQTIISIPMRIQTMLEPV
jgi:hypothetical protein